MMDNVVEKGSSTKEEIKALFDTMLKHNGSSVVYNDNVITREKGKYVVILNDDYADDATQTVWKGLTKAKAIDLLWNWVSGGINPLQRKRLDVVPEDVFWSWDNFTKYFESKLSENGMRMKLAGDEVVRTPSGKYTVTLERGTQKHVFPNMTKKDALTTLWNKNVINLYPQTKPKFAAKDDLALLNRMRKRRLSM